MLEYVPLINLQHPFPIAQLILLLKLLQGTSLKFDDYLGFIDYSLALLIALVVAFLETKRVLLV